MSAPAPVRIAREIPLIPLSEAFLCVSCDTVGNDSRLCWACGSHAVLNLEKALNQAGEEA